MRSGGIFWCHRLGGIERLISESILCPLCSTASFQKAYQFLLGVKAEFIVDMFDVGVDSVSGDVELVADVGHIATTPQITQDFQLSFGKAVFLSYPGTTRKMGGVII